MSCLPPLTETVRHVCAAHDVTSTGPDHNLCHGVKELLGLFGPERCMFASNWHINGAVSNSDGPDLASDQDLTMTKKYEFFSSWVSHMTEDEKEWLFAKSAEKFYRI